MGEVNNMKKVISVVMCAVMLLCCVCFAGCNNQSADNQSSSNYSKAEGNISSYLESSTSSEVENTLAKEFIKKDNKEIAKTIYDKLKSEDIYCLYDQSDDDNIKVYFKDSNKTSDENPWLEVSSTKNIKFYNPDPDCLEKYFNALVPLWDDKVQGSEIVNDLKSRSFETGNGLKYNVIDKNNVEYIIHYIDDHYDIEIKFKNVDEQSSLSTSSETENTLAKEFIKKDIKEIAKTIYDKLDSENIYCEYDQSDGENDIVYFRNSGYTLENRSWIGVSETKTIIFYNPDSDCLEKYFNILVPLWDNKTKGSEIVDELTSESYKDADGNKYNTIKKNGVEYKIYYYPKKSYKIDEIYVVFDNDEQSSK